MSHACRRLLLIPLFIAVIFLCGCPPPALRIPWGYQRRPWLPAVTSEQGRLIYVPFANLALAFDRSLQPEGAAASPIGTQVAMVTSGADGTAADELWINAPLERASVRLSETGVKAQFWPDVSPWSPDGRALVYVQNGNLIYRRLAGQPKQLTTTADVFTAAISPDGKQVAFGRKGAKDEDLGLWVVAVTGGEPKQLVPPTHDIYRACAPHWSPDGKWIAFLQAFEGGALGVVSADGSDMRPGLEPAWEPVRWLPDGKTVLFAEVAYGEPGDGIQSYNVETQKTQALAAAGRNATYALSPDATHALVASWKEAGHGKISDAQAEIINLGTLAVEGQPVKLDGSVASCHWAPDGRQMMALVNDPQGRAKLWHSADGLAGLRPVADATAAIGWARQWQRPWWRFWR